jgi:Tfp pilus assembly protein PilF
MVRDAVRSDVHYSRAYYGGFMNEFWSLAVEKAYGDLDEVIRAREVRYSTTPEDAGNTSGLALNYMTVGDTTKALEIVTNNWARFIDNPDVILGMGAILFQTKNYENAEKIYQSYFDSGGRDHRILHDFGAYKEHRGETDSAYYLYDLSFRVWPQAPPNLEMVFCLTSLKHGYPSIARDGFERILPKLPPDDAISVKNLLSALDRNNFGQADSISALLYQSLKARSSQRR